MYVCVKEEEMARDVGIPKLGLTMVEATITEWKAQEGQQVNQNQVILVIETEKTTYDIEAISSGILHILTSAGQTVSVGHVVGLLAESGDEYQKLTEGGARAPRGPEIGIQVAAPPVRVEAQAPAETPAGEERVKISPVARKLAEESGIDVRKVTGTGPGGRIIKEDVEKAIAEKAKAPVAAAPAPPAPAAVAAPAPAAAQVQTRPIAPRQDVAELAGLKKVKEVIPLIGTRKTIADNLWRSLQIAAQMTSSTELDATELIKFRQWLVEHQERIGARITYTDIFVMAVAKALKMHPIVNSSIIGDEIRVWETINIGVAVDMDLEQMPGLIVPVVHNADRKGLLEIHKVLADISKKARERTLMPDEVAGSTFTISSTGGAGGGIAEGGGSSFGTPILNLGEVGLLGVGGIVKKPVVRNDEIVIRPLLSVSFTTDHRVVDGAPAGRFMGTLSTFLEDPYWMLV
jgi:pyruvate dehydrogenase E2 component (dihydrolipoamide acetyltransferase)